MKTYLTNEEAAQFLGWKPGTLDRRRWLGQGPKFCRVGRSIRYKAEDLEAFIVSGEAQ
ncbi:helix-turn-helix domain-containing protein [Novosphingobium album (ex Hu et al. 2023)]|uniref:Helix-turn-helix domain-containing protein n=1 Tax=Novosphingobium album (ex Hu et al. 2023) TaxID=2930093 RepID=A0ABT0B6W2_9SPHN|nr:helix-turn-helix domain-containing protein [Novosphingobium album (ex Hu et al. 2023)]MCJ2180816.1 helix-turn-helix domain-containing protein [Novosphingobium album (ex Hu et al. 2023)]